MINYLCKATVFLFISLLSINISFAEKQKIQLGSFIDSQRVHSSNIRLNNGTDSVQAIIPISSQVNVNSIDVSIKFINSTSLAKSRSQLRLRFNGKVVGQIPLDPNYPAGKINLKIPGSTVVSGENTLYIESSLHTTQVNSSLFSSELWVEIDTTRSILTINSTKKEVATNISNLPSLLSTSPGQKQRSISIVTAEDSLSDTLLNASATASQTLAKFTSKVPLKIDAQQLKKEKGYEGLNAIKITQPAQDIVLLGTFSTLAKTLGKDFFSDQENKSSFIGLYKNPKYPTKFILIIAGTSDNDILEVSRYLSNLNMALVNTSVLSFGKNKIPDPTLSPQANSIKPDMRYTFSQIGMEDIILTGISDFANLEVKLPVDWFAIADKDIELILHLTYASNLEYGSSISVLLNGEFQHSIPMNEPGGLHVTSWRIPIPLRSFKRGSNTIRFQGNIVPSIAAKEHLHMSDAIKVTIFKDSVIRVPEISHYTKLPALNLLQSVAFPYIEDGESVLIIPEKNMNYISSALTLIAKLSQVHNRNMDNMTLSSDIERHQMKNIFLLSDFKHISKMIWEASPMEIRGNSVWMPMNDAFMYSGVPMNILTSLINSDQMLGAFTRLASSKTLQELDTTQYSVLTQFESPFMTNRTFTLIATDSAESLQKATYALVDKNTWDKIDKDSFIWVNKGQETHSFKLSNEYHTGELSFFGKVSYYAITSPLFLLLLVVVLISILTLLTRTLLMRHSKFHSSH